MRIGILGSGIVARTLGSGFIKHGHQVRLGTREPNQKEVRDWATKNADAAVGAFSEAAAFGDLLVLAVLGSAVERVIELAKPEHFLGKTVIDTTNPLSNSPAVHGVLSYFTGPNESLAERIQRMLPEAHIVKAFNSVGNAQMVNPHYEQGTPTMFFCGDDPSAKSQVAEILRQFGWEPFDCGEIIAARAIEPLCMLWCIPGFLRNQWTHAFKVLTH
jgi:8-hydroxy-5-deazaflavin:NADPH oxidoreductase